MGATTSQESSPLTQTPDQGFMAWRRIRRRSARILVGAVGIAMAIGLWALLAQRSVVIPGPWEVAVHIKDNLLASEYLEQRGMSTGIGYLGHILFTSRNVLAGVGIGALIGITLGLNSLRVPIIREVVNPLTAAFGAAPIFVAAPFFLIWFGIQPAAQVAMVGFYTTLLLYVFSRRAGENIEAHYIESALMLGGESRSIFKWIYLPGTVPEITGGFRIALAGAWGLAALAELLGAQQGAGFLIKFFATAFRVDGMISIVVLLGLVAILFDYIVVVAGRYLTRWSESGRRLGF